MYSHKPVMLESVIECLDIQPENTVIDCTLGEGGHAQEFLKRASCGLLIGIEQDEEMLVRAGERLREFGKRFVGVRDNFMNIAGIVSQRGALPVDRVFFDLGVSTYHFTESGRGFSFNREEKLDMRLDASKPLSAHEVINQFSTRRLTELIWAYGEERFAGRIAHFISEARSKKEISTSTQLADIVKGAVPRKMWPKKIHPATKTFQAVRIFVNDEIDILEKSLRDAVDLLRPGGRIAVISFHSLEDRIVKTVFRELARGCTCPPDYPVCVCGNRRKLKVLTKKPIMPGEEEIETNPSSRSARLRCAVKLREGHAKTEEVVRKSA
jgi:16S rRNA (cytosine1402-N4)-methyltransferase